MRRLTLWGLLLGTLVLTGCSTVQGVKEWVTGRREETPQVKETRWVLVKNPRFEANMAEPEWIWVEDDKIPTTLNSLLFGKQSVLAPPDVVAKYGAPPGGGQLSSLQGGKTQVASRTPTALPRTALRSSAAVEAPAELTPRGYVVYVDKQRVVVDLTAQDGLKKGSLLSLRRERIRVTHPVTGEYLGDLDEEIGQARVVELRERFSVAEVKEVRAGYQVEPKDRVVVREE